MNWTRFLRLLTNLPERHIRALQWFHEQTGQELGWPSPLSDGTLVAGKAKGIYKPAWSKYALSVRQSLSGKYPDREIERRPDGNWHFQYFQETLDPSERDLQFTNLGLIECWKDVVPVGVMIQISTRPRPRYRIMGLAIVTGWESGYFTLEGSSEVVAASDFMIAESPHAIYRADVIAGGFDPASVIDQRREALRLVAIRQGQQGFRRTLLSAYGGRCAISGYDAEGALEAVHIVPYRGPVTNHPSNGLLLRADLHNLFDLGLIAIDTETNGVIASNEIQRTLYCFDLKDRLLTRPANPDLGPSSMALGQHRTWAGM